MNATDPPYRLVRPAPTVAPTLDAEQQAVADLASAPGCGPLLVLAGPGTGKTTTLVEAVAARVAGGTAPERVLVLTFSRRAAQELRARIAARLGRATAEPLAWTFHAFAMRVLGEASALDPELVPPPVLLAGPAQDVVLRELVAGAVEDGSSPWPASFGAALATRGFADELRRLLARTSALGLEPAQLAAVALEAGRGDWSAAARFYDEYLDVTEAQGVVDYAELVGRAVNFAAGPGGRRLRERYDLVVVDEYQDTDPMQEQLLRALAGDGRDLVVVGDPDQSIYAFRGAEVRNILDFPLRFRGRDGAPARVRALRTCRRSGSVLLAASRAVAAPLPAVPVGDVATARDHRALVPADGTADGLVEVLTFPHEAAEATAVADLLRREHLEGGTPWSSMAVLVRSMTLSGVRLRRALAAAGVPVEVAADEVPLARHPAVEPLLRALAVAVDLARPEPHGVLTPDVAHALLVSPLGGADSVQLRRLGRLLRVDDAEAGDPDTDEKRDEGEGEAAVDVVRVGGARPSAQLLRDAVLDPGLVVGVDERLAAPVLRLGALLRATAERVAGGASAYEVLWAVWSATPWPVRLERTARAGGAEGRRADQDLDAVLALFDVASRHDHDATTGRRRGVANFVEDLAHQQVPGDTLAESAARPSGVRLLTAHRSKGLEWDVVAVVGVQDEVWPDLRRRGSLLEADRLAADGVAPPLLARELLAEERRLFYVAVTRARRRLVVTAVDSALEDGLRASRFVHDLGVEPRAVDRPATRPLVLDALVAELRAAACDPSSSEALRTAAVARLAVLADADVGGRALVPAADPARWWGVRDLTVADVPLVGDGEPVPLSGSSLDALAGCPARWLLARQVHGEGPRGPAMSMGSVVHALVDGVSTGALPAEHGALVAALDAVWHQVMFDAPWQAEIERASVVEALGRFLRWNAAHADEGRLPVATEVGFRFELDADGVPVVLRGRLDRLDRDADGRLVVVDYKTGRTSPSGAEVVVDAQLGTYQAAVEAGGFEPPLDLGDEPVLGGAELVQLRQGTAKGEPKVQQQPPLHAPASGRDAYDPGGGTDWFGVMAAAAARRVVDEQLPAVPGKACQVCAFTASCPAQESGRQVVR